jgi:hypothetical protein
MFNSKFIQAYIFVQILKCTLFASAMFNLFELTETPSRSHFEQMSRKVSLYSAQDTYDPDEEENKVYYNSKRVAVAASNGIPGMAGKPTNYNLTAPGQLTPFQNLIAKMPKAPFQNAPGTEIFTENARKHNFAHSFSLLVTPETRLTNLASDPESRTFAHACSIMKFHLSFICDPNSEEKMIFREAQSKMIRGPPLSNGNSLGSVLSLAALNRKLATETITQGGMTNISHDDPDKILESYRYTGVLENSDIANDEISDNMFDMKNADDMQYKSCKIVTAGTTFIYNLFAQWKEPKIDGVEFINGSEVGAYLFLLLYWTDIIDKSGTKRQVYQFLPFAVRSPKDVFHNMRPDKSGKHESRVIYIGRTTLPQGTNVISKENGKDLLRLHNAYTPDAKDNDAQQSAQTMLCLPDKLGVVLTFTNPLECNV